MAAKKDYVRRLRKELQQLIKEPVPHIEALPNPNNILEWHYVITGPSGTPYQGGLYHGKLKFPSEYPLKPPGILMLTPNGRFKTNSRLCLSMSDFHPETWNPLWSVGSILTGLLSFMLEDKPTAGSIQTSDSEKRQFARHSMEFNKKDPMFKKLFPHLIERYEREAQEEAAKQQAAASEGQEAGGGGETQKQQQGEEEEEEEEEAAEQRDEKEEPEGEGEAATAPKPPQQQQPQQRRKKGGKKKGRRGRR